MKQRQTLILLFLMFAMTTWAQDVIVMHDGSTILSKVLEVSETSIKYKKFKNLNGPTYTITIAKVQSINYENGERDTFGKQLPSENVANQVQTENSNEPKLIKKEPDARNAEIIRLHSQLYQPSQRLKKTNSAAKKFFIIYGLKKSSVVSTEDIEMTFKRHYDGYYYYTIDLKNKTDKTIYIDRGNCFRIDQNGRSYCYYDPSSQTTVTDGSGGGISLGLGGIAGKLGVGVSGGSGSSVATTYSLQRVLAISPHGTCSLSEEKWINLSTGLFGPAPERVESAEDFNIYNKNSSDFGSYLGIVKCGETFIADESTLPLARKYYITYSLDASFRTYSTLNADIFIHEILGSKYDNFSGSGKFIDNKLIEGMTDYTIEGYHKLKE